MADRAGPDLLIKAAKDQSFESDNMGAAKVWTEEGEQPRPDKTLSELRGWSWLGFLGLDHFYLRSPLTGLAKALSLGGVGLWWLWDLLQVYTEGDRVAKLGMSLPLDLKMGIAQGMITDGPAEYQQRSSFSKWQFAALFGFLGLDSFVIGKWGQGARKLVEFIFLLIGVASLIAAWVQSGFFGLLAFDKIITIIMVVFFGSIVITNWGLSLKSIFTLPKDLFKAGIKVPKQLDEMLNSYTSILNLMKIFMGEDLVNQVKSDMNYGEITGEELKKSFAIERKEVIQQEANAPQKAADSDNKWVVSFLIWLFLLPLFGVQLLVAIVKGFIYFIYPPKAVTDIVTGVAIKKAEIAAKIAEEQLKAAAAAGAALPTFHFDQRQEDQQQENWERNPQSNQQPQVGGARKSELSTEATVLGAAVIALIGGGALKAAVDYLVGE